jgi:hypothetical protein
MNATDRLADPGFGNYMLNGLREVTLPEPPSYRPQTMGWVILAIAGLLLLSLWSIQRYRTWRKNRYRRAALHQLKSLEQLAQDPSHRLEALRALPILLKRTALAAYSRDQVASLHSDDWLAFLDQTHPGNDFTQGDGRLLVQLAYQSPTAIAQLSSETVAQLISISRTWIAHHRC